VATAPTENAVQDALAAAIKAYVERFEAGERFPPFETAHGVTATEAVIATSQILKAADVAVHELAMWEAWNRE
jgi:hypothetical protein